MLCNLLYNRYVQLRELECAIIFYGLIHEGRLYFMAVNGDRLYRL